MRIKVLRARVEIPLSKAETMPISKDELRPLALMLIRNILSKEGHSKISLTTRGPRVRYHNLQMGVEAT